MTTDQASKTIAVAGTKIWTSLSTDLWLRLQSLQTFQQKLKRCLCAISTSEDI